MGSTALTSWSYGKTRGATNSPRAMGSDNYFTANDTTAFLARLARGELLAADATASLLEWMTWAPRSGYGGWLGTRLPAPARASMRHKAGWLPPGCCSADAWYNTMNEIGLVEAPGGVYAVSILARRGGDYWGKQTAAVELASCLVYRAIADDESLACFKASDPAPAGDPCGGLTYQGECDGSIVRWCENGLRDKDCAAQGKVCGWQSDAVGYNCLASTDAPAEPEPEPAGCGDLTYQGTCTDGHLVWCEDAAVRTKTCQATQTCTWVDDAIGWDCR
jgi:hypothetical protein